MENHSTLNELTIHLIGCGKMGSSLLKGWLKMGASIKNIRVSDPHPTDWLTSLANNGLNLNPKRMPSSEVVVIATKPQLINSLGNTVQNFDNPETIIVSIAAGTTVASLGGVCGKNRAIVRAMPNIPASIGHGVSGYFANEHTTPIQIERVEALLNAVGTVVRLQTEEQLHAVTAVSGSGPTYVFALAEALENAGVAAGLSTDVAKLLAIETINGSNALMVNSAMHPSELRSNVTSPNGTTQAGLKVLLDETNGLQNLIRRTIFAARERSVELSL